MDGGIMNLAGTLSELLPMQAGVPNFVFFYEINDFIDDELINEYLPLVKYVVGRMAVTLPPTVDADDLIGYGVMGLITAIERFSPERGSKFETFAVSRIRGWLRAPQKWVRTSRSTSR